MAPASYLNIQTPWEGLRRVFEANAAAVIGGYAPQVRYRTSDGRWLVIWQGDVVTFRDAGDGDGQTQAEAIADHRIAMALVGLFQDDRIAQLSAAVLHTSDTPAIAGSGKHDPRVRQVAGGFEVSDGTFTATYEDYKTADRVAAWLANPDDIRRLDDVVTPPPSPAPPLAADEPSAAPAG